MCSSLNYAITGSIKRFDSRVNNFSADRRRRMLILGVLWTFRMALTSGVEGSGAGWGVLKDLSNVRVAKVFIRWFRLELILGGLGGWFWFGFLS